jgi:hypothetical protein
MASEKTRSLSQDQIPAQAPPVGGGLDLPDEVHRRLQLAEDCRGADEEGDEADDGRERAPLRARGGENAVHQLTAGRAHKAFELGGQLTDHLLPIEHHPHQSCAARMVTRQRVLIRMAHLRSGI